MYDPYLRAEIEKYLKFEDRLNLHVALNLPKFDLFDERTYRRNRDEFIAYHHEKCRYIFHDICQWLAEGYRATTQCFVFFVKLKRDGVFIVPDFTPIYARKVPCFNMSCLYNKSKTLLGRKQFNSDLRLCALYNSAFRTSNDQTLFRIFLDIKCHQFMMAPAVRIFTAIKSACIIGPWQRTDHCGLLMEQEIPFFHLFLAAEDYDALVDECERYNRYVDLAERLNSVDSAALSFSVFANINGLFGTVPTKERCNLFMLQFPPDWRLLEESKGNLRVLRWSFGYTELGQNFSCKFGRTALTVQLSNRGRQRAIPIDRDTVSIALSSPMKRYLVMHWLCTNYLVLEEFGFDTFEYNLNCVPPNAFKWLQRQSHYLRLFPDALDIFNDSL
jgi:hypothetical protein